MMEHKVKHNRITIEVDDFIRSQKYGDYFCKNCEDSLIIHPDTNKMVHALSYNNEGCGIGGIIKQILNNRRTYGQWINDDTRIEILKTHLKLDENVIMEEYDFRS